MTYFKRTASYGILLFISLGLLGCAGTRHQQSTGEWIDSKSVGARVKAALWDDPMVNGFDIGVDVWRDVVQLSGFVDSAEQIKRAEDIAWGIEGVRDVENKLTIKAPDANVSNPENTGNPSNPNTVTPNQRTPLSPSSTAEMSSPTPPNNSSATVRTTSPTLASGTAGVSFDQGAGQQSRTVTLSDLASETQQLEDRNVTVNGTVKSVVGESAFVLTDPNGKESVLVVGDSSVVGGLKQGATVSVEGNVRQFNRLQLEREHGVRLDDTGAAQWRNRATLFAEEINAQ